MFFEDTDSSWVISPVGEVSLAQSSAVGQKHLASKSQSRPLHLSGPSYQQHIAVLESDQSEKCFFGQVPFCKARKLENLLNIVKLANFLFWCAKV